MTRPTSREIIIENGSGVPYLAQVEERPRRPTLDPPLEELPVPRRLPIDLGYMSLANVGAHHATDEHHDPLSSTATSNSGPTGAPAANLPVLVASRSEQGEQFAPAMADASEPAGGPQQQERGQ